MDTNLVKELREITGLSVMDCNNALKESNGDLKGAIEILKRKGHAAALRRSGRETKSGIIYSYIHSNSKVGVLLDIRCETDFVAKNEKFQELAREIALQIAAMAPEFVSPEQVPEEFLVKEKAIYQKEIEGSNKPANILSQIIEGKIQKRLSEICLINQEYIKEPGKKIEELIKEYITKIGENISIIKFARFEI